MTQNNCTECGATINSADKFCTECGATIKTQNPNPYPTNVPIQTINNRYLPISTIGYFGIFILIAIPLVNLIVLIFWAVSNTNKISLRNFARGALLFMVFMLIVFIVFGIFFGFFIHTIINDIFDWSDSYNWNDIQSTLHNKTEVHHMVNFFNIALIKLP